MAFSAILHLKENLVVHLECVIKYFIPETIPDTHILTHILTHTDIPMN